MDMLKKFFPFAFKVKAKDVTGLIVSIIIHLVAGLVISLVLGLLGTILGFDGFNLIGAAAGSQYCAESQAASHEGDNLEHLLIHKNS